MLLGERLRPFLDYFLDYKSLGVLWWCSGCLDISAGRWATFGLHRATLKDLNALTTRWSGFESLSAHLCDVAGHRGHVSQDIADSLGRA